MKKKIIILGSVFLLAILIFFLGKITTITSGVIDDENEDENKINLKDVKCQEDLDSCLKKNKQKCQEKYSDCLQKMTPGQFFILPDGRKVVMMVKNSPVLAGEVGEN